MLGFAPANVIPGAFVEEIKYGAGDVRNDNYPGSGVVTVGKAKIIMPSEMRIINR